MSKANLMLGLNEALQKAGEKLKTRFCQVKYLPSGAVSTFLTKKANAGLLISRLSNALFWATKIINAVIVSVEIFKH